LKTYEAVFILDERQFDDEGKAFAQKVIDKITELGGSERKTESLGRRQFARPIGKQTSGIYWDFIFDLPSSQVNTLKEEYRLMESVLRMSVFLYEAPEVPEPQKE